MQPCFFEQCLQDLRLSAAQFGKIFDVPEAVVGHWLTGALPIPPAVEAGFRCLGRYKSMDDAVNFGGIGVVIGHELTHGFDDQGRKFDPQGNLRDWWTPEDGKEFEARASCIANEYGGFTAIDDLKRYQKFSEAHVTGLKNLIASFGTLYSAMPDAQKKNADMVFETSGRHGAAHS